MLRLVHLVIVVCLLCLVFSAPGAAWAQYAITDLGVIGSGPDSQAWGVNSAGQVTGWSGPTATLNLGAHAFLATGGPPMTDLNASLGGGGAVSEGDGITDTGLVGGLAYSSSAPNERAVIYNATTAVTTDLTTVPGFINGLNSWTYAVNNSGQAVGWSAASYPFFFDGSTTVQLPGLGGQLNTNTAYPYALNNNGVVVGGGLAGGTDPTQHPFVWTQADGTQPLFSPINPSGDARGVNDNGVVVGGTTDAGAFYATTVGGSVQSAEVGALGAATDAVLLAVDALNQAVGWSCTDAANTIVHAVYYQPSTGMIDLNSTAEVVNLGGWTLTEATAVSSNGRYIVGYGTNASGQERAFLLTALLPGDANLDGTVDINDLTIVLANYGQTGTTWTQGEFTGDGTVDINDLTIVLAHYGEPLGSSGAGLSAVPEPSSIVLLAAGLVGILAGFGRKRDSGQGAASAKAGLLSRSER